MPQQRSNDDATASSPTLTLENAERQVTEITNFWKRHGEDALVLHTPSLFERLRRCVRSSSDPSKARKRLCLSVRCDRLVVDETKWTNRLIVDVSFPGDYPSASACEITAVRDRVSSAELPRCAATLRTYASSFCGCECLEMIAEWLRDQEDDDESRLLDAADDDETTTTTTTDGVGCFVLRYNHLLKGPEHKKEKAMMDAAKKARLQGGLLWGTPGVVIVVPPSTEEDAKDYARECRTIGKTANGPDPVRLPAQGLEDSGLGGLAQQKRGGRLREMDKETLRTSCGNAETLVRTVLGLV